MSTARVCYTLFIVIAIGAAIVAPSTSCILPDKTIGEEPQACPDAQGLTAFLGGGSCEACVASKCCEDAALCAGEAACEAHVACIRKCSASDETVNPPCFDDCRTRPRTELSDKLFSCSDTYCREECSLGTTFECAGAYRWPTARMDEIAVNLRIVQPFVSPVSSYPSENRVMPCQFGQWPCSFDPDESVSTENGLVRLRIPTTKPLFSKRDNWTGYFIIERSDDLRTTLLYQNRGEYRDREVEDLPIPNDETLSLYDGKVAGGGGDGAGGGDGDGEVLNGIVAGQLLDCRGLLNYGGAGLILSVVPEDPGASLPVTIYISDVIPDSRLTSTGPSGRFLVKDVPLGRVRASVRREADGSFVAEEEMIVEAGALTVLGIFPRTFPR